MSAQIMQEILKILEAPHTQANYPQVMLREILRRGGVASKPQITHALFMANRDMGQDEAYFKSVPVYKRNKSIQSIINIDKLGKVEYYHIKFYQELTNDEVKNLMKICAKMANSWEIIQ